MVNVKGKWAFITGASRGLGRLTALYFAGEGCNLILQSRTLESSKEIAEKCREKGVQVYAVAAELSKADEVETMLKEIDALNVSVEIVLNNAGLQVGYRTDYLNTPIADFPVSFAINTIAPMQICYHFVPKMLENGFGRIVNTTSGIALEAEQAGYSASKAALDKVTIDLGYKLNGTDVIISLTDPGWCRTDLGGPNAPNAPESALPGVFVGAFVDDKKSGRLFRAQEFSGLSLEEAVKKAESVDAPYNR